MLNYSYQVKILAKRLLVVYLIYFLCRIIFFIVNPSAFSSVSIPSLLSDCFWGLRFDTFSIFVSNSLFILLSILPFKAYYSNGYQKTLKWIYIILNSIFVLANCIDFGYFAYTKQRSGADLFNQIGGQTDLGRLLPQYIADFWWIIIVFAALLFLLIKIYGKIKIKSEIVSEKLSVKNKVVLLFVVLFQISLVVLGIRGGFQRIPVDVVDAGGMVPPEEVAIVLNTPFVIIKSLDKKSLTEYHFYDEQTLKQKFNPIHQFDSLTLKKKNVVVLILESFAKEYTKLGKTISYTPFLDSLMDYSLVFTNAYANGAKSIEGVPAILSSLPSMMENPVINSPYAGNSQSTFANLLKPEGYTSAFFHGGINGTMNFDAYARLAGYQNYFGRNEYNNDNDFDGVWGIWDEEFLQYTITKMNELKPPFHSSIFTLSSHHPYYIPKKHKGKFAKGHLENSESIRYADYSLKQFFNSAKKTDWYNNTLFILVADHSSISEHPFYSNLVGQKSIPILFFQADNSLKGVNNSSFSQIDILPSALNLMGYNKPFFAYGQSYLNRKNNNCYFFNNGTFNVVCDSILFCFNGNEINTVNCFKTDSLLQTNILNQYPEHVKNKNDELKAFLQTFNNTLLNNKGFLK